MTLGDAADLLSRLLGIRLDNRKVYHWCLDGSQNVKLECVRDGRSLFTAREAVVRFVRWLLEADDGGYGYFHRLGVPSKAEVATALEDRVERDSPCVLHGKIVSERSGIVPPACCTPRLG